MSLPAAAITAVETQIGRQAEQSQWPLGLAATHIESGTSIAHNAEQVFPMASTYKVPMAITAFEQIEQGRLSLDQQVEIEYADYVPSGVIADHLRQAGTRLPLKTLIELMLILSDNTATDVVLRTIGGSDAVMDKLGRLGITPMNVARSTSDLIREYYDFPPLNDRVAKGQSLLVAFGELMADENQLRTFNRCVDERSTDLAWLANWEADPRDKASPAAMTELLVRTWNGEALTPDSTKLLFEIMQRCETGKNRIRGMLPPGTPVADKTGTLDGAGGVVNNTGIITLPDQLGHIALTIYTSIQSRDYTAQEGPLAQLARTVYDFFVVQTAAAS